MKPPITEKERGESVAGREEGGKEAERQRERERNRATFPKEQFLGSKGKFAGKAHLLAAASHPACLTISPRNLCFSDPYTAPYLSPYTSSTRCFSERVL